jgi:hypothetical protein
VDDSATPSWSSFNSVFLPVARHAT